MSFFVSCNLFNLITPTERKIPSMIPTDRPATIPILRLKDNNAPQSIAINKKPVTPIFFHFVGRNSMLIMALPIAPSQLKRLILSMYHCCYQR